MSCRRRKHRAERARRAGDTQNCSFTHDDLGRLASVNCGGEWSQTFTTDAFGDVAVTSGNDAFPASFSNDRISTVNGFAPNYDNDGNLLDNPLTQTRNVYGWDADGRPVEVDGVSQTFDALGRVVENSETPAEFLWTPGGDKIAVMGGQSLYFALVPLPGGGAAEYDAASGLYNYAHPDWEGSWRLGSSPSRTETGDGAYSPYGIGYPGSAPGEFAGHWSDTPDNLDDAPYRLLAPMTGRWLSPDPAGIAAVNPANPQTWNEYAYVGDTPLQATDPLGLVCAAGQCTDGSPQFVLGLGFMASGGPSGQWPNSLTSIQFLDELPGGGGAFLSMGEVGGPVAPPATAGYNPGGAGSTVGSTSKGMGVGPGPAQGPFTWVPFGAQAWIGVTLPGGPSQDAAPGSNGMVSFVKAYSALMRPLEMAAANGAIAATGLASLSLGGASFTLGCLDPTPFEPATCTAGVAGLVTLGGNGVGELGLAYYFFNHYTVPAFENWGKP